MNWKKGLVRLWIAVSLLWMICFLIYFAPAEQQSPDTIYLVAIMIGPPIAFPTLVFAVWWIIAGFE